VFDLARENVIKVGAVAHPSLLKIPGDLGSLGQQSKAAILINSCDVDDQFPKEACEAADKLLGEGNYAPGYKRVHWDGCVHGFAVRGDLVSYHHFKYLKSHEIVYFVIKSDPNIKAGKEGAFKETVTWIKTYLSR
jgi:hypothetical protein